MRILELEDIIGYGTVTTWAREKGYSLACPICVTETYHNCPHSVAEMLKHLLAPPNVQTLPRQPDTEPAPPLAQEPQDWFTRYLAGDKQARKQAPLARGLAGYFPNACLHVAHVSYVANEQHNPGLPLQWAFDKSSDEPDCELRHMLDAMGASPFDDDGLLHLAKKAWRALADCERYVLANYPGARPGASVTGFTRESASQKASK